MTTKRQAVALTLASAVLFGTSGTAQALGPDGLTPIATSGARLLSGALVLVAMLPALGFRIADVLPMLRSRGAWLAAGCVCLFQAGYFTAAQRSGVALGALVTMGTIPLITGFAGTLLGHRITGTWLVSTLVCASGLVLLGYQGVSAGQATGVIAAVVAAAAGAGFTLSVKHLLDAGAPSMPAQAAVFMLAGVSMAVAAVVTGPVTWVGTPRGFALVAWLGLFTMALPNILWLKGLGVLSPGITATLLIGEPMTATLLGIAVLHETLTFSGVVGLIAVATGLAALGVAESRSKSMVHSD